VYLFIFPLFQQFGIRDGRNLGLFSMADAGANMSNPSIPLFKGENYDFWSIKITTLFKSYGLWELVEKGAGTTTDDQKKDERALFFIQSAMHESIFTKISLATTAKDAWTILKTVFQGSSKVIAIKLQGLRREFETPAETSRAFSTSRC
jgi:gag-polypeptide of LTR copia-type